MNLEVRQLSQEEWRPFSENAHLVVFNSTKPQEMERIDYALLCVSGVDVLGYVTCRELDYESVYWQYGGMFPGTRQTVRAFSVYNKFIEWARSRYKRIMFYVENKNNAMLKFAMKIGFCVIGVRNIRGEVYLEHILEF